VHEFQRHIQKQNGQSLNRTYHNHLKILFIITTQDTKYSKTGEYATDRNIPQIIYE